MSGVHVNAVVVRVDHIFIHSIVTRHANSRVYRGATVTSTYNMPPNSNRTRRTFVKALGAAALAAIAGSLKKSGNDDLDNQDAEPLEPAGESPDEHIEEFHILEVEFTDNSQFEVRFQNEGDQTADLANYDVQFDLFGSRQQYTGTLTFSRA